MHKFQDHITIMMPPWRDIFVAADTCRSLYVCLSVCVTLASIETALVDEDDDDGVHDSQGSRAGLVAPPYECSPVTRLEAIIMRVARERALVVEEAARK